MAAKKTRGGLAVVLFSMLFFVASLPTPALLFQTQKPVIGLTALMWGWWGVLTGDFPRVANPVYFVAIVLVFVGLYKPGAILAAIAIMLGYTSVYAKAWWFNEGSGTPIIGLGLAFHFWMASFVVLLIGSIVVHFTARRDSAAT